MRIYEVMERGGWDESLQAIQFQAFTQSYVWGKFQKSLGKQVKHLRIEKRGVLLALLQIQFEKRSWVGGYWLAPKGPQFTKQGHRERFNVLKEIRKYATEQLRDGVFLRIEPQLYACEIQIPEGWERKKALNPSSTRRLRLSKSEAELLQEMHQKTRYNIRLSEKKLLNIFLADEKQMPDFLALMQETATRGGFTQHDNVYLQKTFQYLHNEGMAKLRLARFEDRVIAGQIEIWSGDTVTYLYGASSSAQRNLMAPYALHWNTICEAKESGFDWYDFWGENPESARSIDYKENWKGISRYKKGFGGEHVEFMGTFDSPIRKNLYTILRALGRI